MRQDLRCASRGRESNPGSWQLPRSPGSCCPLLSTLGSHETVQMAPWNQRSLTKTVLFMEYPRRDKWETTFLKELFPDNTQAAMGFFFLQSRSLLASWLTTWKSLMAWNYPNWWLLPIYHCRPLIMLPIAPAVLMVEVPPWRRLINASQWPFSLSSFSSRTSPFHCHPTRWSLLTAEWGAWLRLANKR